MHGLARKSEREEKKQRHERGAKAQPQSAQKWHCGRAAEGVGEGGVLRGGRGGRESG